MKLLTAFALSLLACLELQAGGVQSDIEKPYRKFDETQILNFITSISSSLNQHQNKVDGKKDKILGEVAALDSLYRQYNPLAPVHRTDGWSDFHDAEWPFMGLCYFGLSLCQLSGKYPSNKKAMEEKVYGILKLIKRDAVSGFMIDHFGVPFPVHRGIKSTSTFVHGHYLYLALKARASFGNKSEDAWIHAVARALGRDFQKQKLLKSYRTMYYLSDNFSSLAALSIYDKTFAKKESKAIIANALHEIQKHYLDPRTGLFSTYINLSEKKIDEGARGISVMYGLMYLPDIDIAFAKSQWQLAKKHFLRDFAAILRKNGSFIPFIDSISNVVKGHVVSMEFPDIPQVSFVEKNFSDGDSGPIVLGVGPSASGFAIAAAKRNGDKVMYEKISSLALKLGAPQWKGDKLFYLNMFHEVGQTIVLYGKSLDFP